MDEGKFAAEFVTHNIEKIINLGKAAFGNADELLQIKLKTAYTEYLKTSREKYSKAKSFFIRNQSVDLYSYYVPTGITCNANYIPAPSFNRCIEASQRIVIAGSGGCGKSVLMKHLFLDCIRDKVYAPVMIELRDLNNEEKTLDEYISHTLDTYGFKVTGDYIKRAKQAGHFCFFLDGYDEVNYSIRKRLLRQIVSLSNKFSKCPIFISSRPDDVFNGLDDFSVYKVQPLNLDAALNLVGKLPFDEEIKKKFTINLASGLFDQHESFLSNPLLLSIMLLTYSENAEIPTKLSIFYNQAYEALFQRHDANKGGYSRDRLTDLDIQDFARVFSLFALQTYEKRLFKMPRTECFNFIEKSRDSLLKVFKVEDYLEDLLSAACLLVEEGLEVAFSHRSFQEYFVALHISTAPPDIQEKLILRYWPNMNSDNVIALLLEINPELIERILVVPELDKLFIELNVKRAIGASHCLNYLKKSFTKLNIEPNGFSATKLNMKADICDIVSIAADYCPNYKFPDESYFESRQIEMYKKYGNNDERGEYPLKSLNSKSPILIDTLNSEGAFSLKHLTAAFHGYKKLKAKHTNRIQSLDNLLGISGKK